MGIIGVSSFFIEKRTDTNNPLYQDLKNARSSSISDPRARSRWSCRRPIDWEELVGASAIKSGSCADERVLTEMAEPEFALAAPA